MALRAFLAATRAWAAARPFLTTLLASVGFSSSHSAERSLVAFCTNDRIDTLPSLALVWPSNCGSRSLTEMMAVMPSRMSSPVRFVVLLLEQVLRAGVLVDTVGEGRS
jgi:hypothetical protein